MEAKKAYGLARGAGLCPDEGQLVCPATYDASSHLTPECYSGQGRIGADASSTNQDTI